jgi:hypothetical protein
MPFTIRFAEPESMVRQASGDGLADYFADAKDDDVYSTGLTTGKMKRAR